MKGIGVGDMSSTEIRNRKREQKKVTEAAQEQVLRTGGSKYME
jgi:hypothetical protein